MLITIAGVIHVSFIVPAFSTVITSFCRKRRIERMADIDSCLTKHIVVESITLTLALASVADAFARRVHITIAKARAHIALVFLTNLASDILIIVEASEAPQAWLVFLHIPLDFSAISYGSENFLEVCVSTSRFRHMEATRVVKLLIGALPWLRATSWVCALALGVTFLYIPTNAVLAAFNYGMTLAWLSLALMGFIAMYLVVLVRHHEKDMVRTLFTLAHYRTWVLVMIPFCYDAVNNSLGFRIQQYKTSLSTSRLW